MRRAWSGWGPSRRHLSTSTPSQTWLRPFHRLKEVVGPEQDGSPITLELHQAASSASRGAPTLLLGFIILESFELDQKKLRGSCGGDSREGCSLGSIFLLGVPADSIRSTLMQGYGN